MWCSDALSLLSDLLRHWSRKQLALQRILLSFVLSSGCLIFFSVSLRLQLKSQGSLWCAMWMCVFQIIFSVLHLLVNSMLTPLLPKRISLNLVFAVLGSARCLQPCFVQIWQSSFFYLSRRAQPITIHGGYKPGTDVVTCEKQKT